MSYPRLSFARKKYVINKLRLLLMFVIVLSSSVAGFWWGASHVFSDGRYMIFLTPVGFIVLILEIWGVNKLADWFEKKLEAKMDVYDRDAGDAKKGFVGEDMVYTELKILLNSEDYQIYRNLKIPNVKSDLDVVVVGSKGLILIEVKNYEDSSKVVYTASGSFFRSKYNELVKFKLDLRAVVKWRADKLEKYLAERGIDRINVRKVILYVNPESVEMKEYGGNWNHVYIVQGIDKLENYLEGSMPDNRFTPDICSRVGSILSKLELG